VNGREAMLRGLLVVTSSIDSNISSATMAARVSWKRVAVFDCSIFLGGEYAFFHMMSHFG
jgi:hypothetical protein